MKTVMSSRVSGVFHRRELSDERMRNFHIALVIDDEGVEDVEQLVEQSRLAWDSREGSPDDDVHFLAKH